MSDDSATSEAADTAVRVAAATRIQSVVRMMLGGFDFGHVLKCWLRLGRGLPIVPDTARDRLLPANAVHALYGPPAQWSRRGAGGP